MTITVPSAKEVIPFTKKFQRGKRPLACSWMPTWRLVRTRPIGRIAEAGGADEAAGVNGKTPTN